MRISDWSSDVCSSDLPLRLGSALDHQQQPLGLERFLDEIGRAAPDRGDRSIKVAVARDHQHRDRRIAPFDLVEQVEPVQPRARSEEHTSELQSLMSLSYAVFCLKKKNKDTTPNTNSKQ